MLNFFFILNLNLILILLVMFRIILFLVFGVNMVFVNGGEGGLGFKN